MTSIYTTFYTAIYNILTVKVETSKIQMKNFRNLTTADTHVT